MRTAKYLIPLALCLGIGILLSAGLRLNPREVPSPLIGRLAPEFKLPRLLGERLDFRTGDLYGQVWILNVWASWCAACRIEHEFLQVLADERSLVLVGLNYKDDLLQAISWLQVFGNPYSRVAIDLEGDVAIDWGVYGVPETFVMDAEGFIRYKHVGPLNQVIIDKQILPLVRRLTKKTN